MPLKYPSLSMAFILFMLAMLWGCSGKNIPKKPDHLYVRLKSNPTTLDPALIVDVYGAQIAAKLYNGLICFGDDLTPIPDIAAAWSVSSDGLTYFFRLKKGVRFFNGREVTAEDFKYSFERVLNPKTRSPRTWVFSRIAGAKDFMREKSSHVRGIRVRDPYLLEIQLASPFAPFINLLGLTTAYVVASEEVEKWGADYAFHGSGTGPFILKEWQHNQYLTLKANNNYFRGQPSLSGIVYRIIPEDFTALVEFEEGNLDLMLEILPLEFKRYSNDPKWSPYIKTAPGLNTYYLGFNCQVPPFKNHLVRQALNYAIDREKMLNTLLEGRGTAAKGPLPPILRGEKSFDSYSYNPSKAKELLREAGYPNVVRLEWSSFKEAVTKGEAQSFWLSWWADYPDGENFLFPLFHSDNWGAAGNRSRFKNARVNELLAHSVKIMDIEKRLAVYREIEELVLNEAPWVFFWHKANSSIHQPWVKGFVLTPIPVMEKWTGISLRPEKVKG
jgi:peptide/nickel transport system substrate-binding protein/oligopeptide transport system substrate-binding protein